MSETVLSWTAAHAVADKRAVTRLDATAAPSSAGIADFTGLRELVLSGNRAIGDLGFLAALPALERLHLDDLGLTALPRELAQLPALRELVVARNAITELDLLAELPQLRTLDIRFNYKLRGWDPIDRLVGLTSLALSNAHALPALPDGVFGLPALRALTIEVHWNAPPDRLNGLAQIGACTELKALCLRGVAITSLPALSGLARLESLTLTGCKELANVDALAGLPALRTLVIDDCAALASVAGLRDLPALEQLTLSRTAVGALPATMSTLRALVSAEITQNAKLRLASGLAELPNLRALILHAPAMKALPDSLGTLTALERLSLITDRATLGFLARLTALRELFVKDCQFDALPAELTALRDLTVLRKADAPGDAWLAQYPALEALKISQTAFTLPVLPALRTLIVNRGDAGLDLANLAAMPALATLELNVSDERTALPALGDAPGLRSLTIDLYEALTDLSALAGLGLVELRIKSCDALVKLPDSLATLTSLELLELEGCSKLGDLAVVGKLLRLRTLILEGLGAVTKLPPLSSALEAVRIKRLDALTDISALAQLPALRSLECDDCRKLSAAKLAAIQNALAPRALTTSYRQFIDSGRYREVVGKAVSTRFPLRFDTPARLLEILEDYSWLDDLRDEGGDLADLLDGRPTALQPLAVLDAGHPARPAQLDAYAEEILLVDTADARNPVLHWGHDGHPRVVYPTFDAFLAALRDA